MKYIEIIIPILISIFILATIIINSYKNDNSSNIIINNFTLSPNRKYEALIPIRKSINMTIKSNDSIPFIAKIYRSDGLPLKYKTNIIKYQGKIDYIEITNLGKKKNTIILQMNNVDKVRNLSIRSIMAIVTTTVVIIYEKKSVPTKMMLIILLIVQLYELPYDMEISDRVFKKLLF